MVDKGILRRSLRTETTPEEGKVITEVDYAQIHNEGSEIKSTAQISPLKRKIKGKTEDLKAHTRKIATTMPKRQYMGKSHELNQRSEDNIIKKLDFVFGMNK